MLVLGRKPKESIRIGDDIVITVLAVDGEKIKIGIDAPNSVRILRQELYDTVKAENLRAAQQHNGAVLPKLKNLFDSQ